MDEREVILKLKEYALILDSLYSAGVVRTHNSPVGDYAEWLVCKRLQLQLEKGNEKGYDAFDGESGVKYQIKSCWMHAGRNKCQFSVIRNYDKKQFDYLIAVVFADDFEVAEAYKIPHAVLQDYFPMNDYRNGMVVTLTQAFVQDARVEDITNFFNQAG